MLSQVVKTSRMLRAVRQMQPVLKKNLGSDKAYVCFCGCPDDKHFGKSLTGHRGFSSFHDKLNINDATNLIPAEYKAAD